MPESLPAILLPGLMAAPLPTRLSPPDLAVVAVYLIAITLFGLRFSKRAKQSASTLKTYFLADNTIPWWAIALSIVSAETSTLTIISIPGVAFAGNFGFLQIVLGYLLGRIVVAALFLPRYFRGEMLTAYQLIHRRFSRDGPFGHALYKLTAGLFLLTRAAAEGVRVFAISIVVGIAIGTGDTLSIAIISALTLLYTFEGGMAAVIWTDVVQMILYVAGTLVALFTLGAHVPGGWTHIHAVAAPLGKLRVFSFSLNLTQSYTFWAGLLGGTFLTMASHGTDQLMVQRLLAARSLRESRLALLSSGAVILLQFTLFLLIGAGLFVFYSAGPTPGTPAPIHAPIQAPSRAPLIAPSAMGGTASSGKSGPTSPAPSDITNLSPDRIFPTFIVREMPHGVAGLLVAAILAAAMSNLSAALNSLASTTVVDFFLPFARRRQNNPDIQSEAVIQSEAKDPEGAIPSAASPHSGHEVPRPGQENPLPPIAHQDSPDTTFISRLATVFWAVVLFLIAVYSIQHGGKGHVVETGLSIASVAYGCLLGVFLLGTLIPASSKCAATQFGAILGMVCGLTLNLTLWLLPNANIVFHPDSAHPTILAMPHIAFTWYVLIGSLTTFTIGTVASLLLPNPRKQFAATALLLPGLLCLSFASPSQAQSPPPAPSSSAPSAALPSRPPRSGSPVPPTNGRRTTDNAAPADFTPASALITQAIAAHKLPGAVLLVGHNGKIVFEQAYGNRALEPTPEPMTIDTIFDMASLTKVLVTTTAILQLDEQHKLDLDTPLAHYLPAFTASPRNADSRPATISPVSASRYPRASALGLSSPAEKSRLQPLGYALRPVATNPTLAYKSQITIRQLLTHYSGLPEDVSLRDDWGLAAPDKPEGLRRALAAIPYGPPALTFKYSDINFILLGALVETLSGQRLDDFAQEEIFQPLLRSGMLATSSYHPFDRACPATSSFVGSAVEPGRAPRHSTRSECFLPAWSPTRDDPHTAPTAHDDQGTPATNPNFNHLLRGTVHDPTTRRMGGVAGHAGLFSTAEDTARFCQALLDKLLTNIGPFPLTQATLRLATSPQEPSTAVRTATIFLPDGTPATGPASRGLGWDLNSPFSRPRGTLFPITTGGYGKPGHPGSFGHTGFTGTSLWIDPTSDTYVILLANAIHPRGAAPISALRGEIATAVARALGLSSFPRSPTPVTQSEAVIQSGAKDPHDLDPASTARTLSPQPSPPRPPTLQTLTGIDVLEETHFAALKQIAARHNNHLRIGLLTNQAGRDAQGRSTIDILLHASPEIELKILFAPEHGLSATQDTEHLAPEQESNLPVISLYGPKPSDKHPRQSDLKQLDALVIDLQDAGVRFWTYETLVGHALEACAQAHFAVVLLDRPNPLGGLATQGPTSDPGLDSYTNFMPIPLRHGLTLGELARFFNARAPSPLNPLPPPARAPARAPFIESSAMSGSTQTLPGLHADLTVIPMQNWSRSQFFAETGLPWTPPSPNLRTPRAALLYPALGLIEQTNLSVGRGTPTPFEDLGAPWIDSAALAAYLEARKIPGVRVAQTTLTVAENSNKYPFHGQTVPGIHFEVTDPAAFDSPELGIELLSALHRLFPKEFQLARARTLLASAATLAALNAGPEANADPRTIAASWSPALRDFRARAQPFLLYP